MAERGVALQSLLIDDVDEDMSAAEMIDPIALETRLVEARARRAEALRRRAAAQAGAAPASATPLIFPSPGAAAASPGATPLPAHGRGRGRNRMATGLFAGGLAAGLAVSWFGASVLRESDPVVTPTAAVAPASNDSAGSDGRETADPTVAMVAPAPLGDAPEAGASAALRAARLSDEDVTAPPAPVAAGWDGGATAASGEARLIWVAQSSGPEAPDTPVSPRIAMPAGAAPDSGLAPLATPSALAPPPALVDRDRAAAAAIASGDVARPAAAAGLVAEPLRDSPGARPSALASSGLEALAAPAAPVGAGFDPVAALPTITAPASPAPVAEAPAVDPAPFAETPPDAIVSTPPVSPPLGASTPAVDPLPAIAAPAPRQLPEPAPENAEVAALAPAPTVASEIAEDAGAVIANEAPAADAAPVGARVMVHFPADAAGDAEAVVNALQVAGAGSSSALPVSFGISSTNIRFYHAEDAGAAERVADLLRAAGQQPEIRDFTDFRPQPDAGLVEIWLAGGASAAPARQSARATPVRQSPASSAAAERRRAEEVNRIMLERRVEQLLRARQRP